MSILMLPDCARCPHQDRIPPPAPGLRSLLLRTEFGLGDAVQLTTVLLHLRDLHPQWSIDVVGHAGQASLFRALCRASYAWGEEPRQLYDEVRRLAWHEPDRCYADSPSTKAEKCLREIFGITPRPELCRYQIAPSVVDYAKAARYAAELKRPFALLHYQGNSNAAHKTINGQAVARTVRVLQSRGVTPVILDWNQRSALVRGPGTATSPRPSIQNPKSKIQNPTAGHWLWDGRDFAEGSTLAALAERAVLCLGIDSGPGHVFAATTTPTIIVMQRMHPLHYFGLAENVLHLVPPNHARHLRDNAPAGEAYFRRHYRHRELQANLCDELPAAVAELLAAKGR